MKKNLYPPGLSYLSLSSMLLTALAAIICFFLAAGAYAADLPSSAQFTIKSIKADASGKEVTVEFTASFDRQQAVNHLTITPPTANYRPWESTMPSNLALKINGDFKRGTTYGIKFTTGFTNLSGQPYTETIKEFSVPHQNPKMDFVIPGSVIELNSRQLVHIAVVNVESVIIESQTISPLAFFALQKGVQGNAEELSKLLKDFPKDNPLAHYAGDAAVSHDLYDTKGKPDEEQNFSMPLTNRPNKEKGALLFVTARDNALGGAGSSKPIFYNITDLAITCLAGGDDTLVWVTSISSGLPVAGAEIMAYTASGNFFIAGKTDNDGILRIRTGNKTGYRFTAPETVSGPKIGIDALNLLYYTPQDLKFLCARTENDVAVVGSPDDKNWRLSFTGIRQTSNISVTPKEIRSTLFTERGVYRPGETVHFKAVARSYQNGMIKPAVGDTCTINVQNSKKQTIYSNNLSLGEFGSAALDLPLGASSPLGEYQADFKCGTSSVSTTFRVEEFKPPRHFSRLAFETIKRHDDSYVNHPADLDFLKVKISGGYYAGGPVKNARVRWQLAYGPSSRTIEGYENYTFGHESPSSEPEPLESGETYLDGDGQISLEFPMSREVLAGEKALVVSATVLDFDGRAASVTKSWVAQSPYSVGISQHKSDVEAQSEQQLEAVVVDAAGKRIETGKMEAEILRWGWTYLRKRNLQGNEYWTSERVWRRSSINELALKNGKVSFDAGFEWGGDYLVKFTYFAPDGKSYSSATKFDVGWYDPDEGSTSNRDKNAFRVSLYSDRPSYRPGQTATIRMGTKRKAAAYLTATGRQGLLDYHVVRPKDGLKEIKIPITENHLPNIYATVVGTLARGGFPVYTGGVDDGMPSILYGSMDLPVTKKDEVLSIDIASDLKVLEAEPGQEISLNLVAAGEGGKAGRVELAVAVVDEAVLALTGYSTPELKSLARFDMPLCLFLTDLRAFLLPQTPFKTVRNEALTGGSEGLGLPIDTRKKFEPVAYWNPSLVTDPDGKATVKFTLPDQMSSFRVFVIACDAGCAFGKAERQLRVAKPFYLEPGIPRFFSKGDSFRLEVAAFNQTQESGNVEFSVAEKGGLKVAAEKQSFSLAATDWAPVGITGRAEASGEATLLFKGSFSGKQDAVAMTVPVKSGNVRGQNIYYGSVKGTATIAPALPADAAAVTADTSLHNESSAVLTLSGSPFLRMTAGLRYLLQYPYGCVEQTSSGVMPLAALRAIVKNGNVPGISVDETDKFLAKGVERLLTMQTEDGGFGYWPGDKETSPWGTFYAASALGEAKLSGFEVPKDALDQLGTYLRGHLSQNSDQAGGSVALYLLTRLGYAKPADFPGFIKSIATMDREEAILTLLAASYAKALPDKEIADRMSQVLANNQKAEHHYYDFYATYRADALALMLLDRVTPGSPEGAKLAAKLLDSRDNEGHWHSTSNDGWVLAALGGHFKAAAGKGPHKVEVLLPREKKQVVEFPESGSGEVNIPIADFLADPRLTVNADPEREVLYALTVTLPRIDYAKTGHDGGFTIVKRIENADGSAAIKVGDLVRVTLEFTPPDHESSYIVLDDPLPAGLVAINSAFRSEEVVGEDNDAQTPSSDSTDYWERYWSPDGYYRLIPDHLEIRDDRVLAFRNSLWGWSRSLFRFVYYARAVCEGEFAVPSTRIERMYEPEVNGYTPKTILKIERGRH